MLRLIGIVISIGLADSVNPTTVAPALYLAAGNAPGGHARRQVARFIAGVFLASLIGGLAIDLGPGGLLLGLVPHPRPIVGQWLEVIAGTVLIVVGALLLRLRRVLAKRELFSGSGTTRRPAFLLGAGIMTVELPTAFPYFAAIAAIVGSGRSVADQVTLIAIYNGAFVLPLLGILITLWLFPHHAGEVLGRARQQIQRHWVLMLGTVLIVAGIFVVVLGATGIGAHAHNSFGHFSRSLHKLIT